MPVRKPKPTSPGLRFVSYPDFAEITKTEPERTLVEGLKKSGGRNSNGRKTSRHRGGGAKRLYRKIDFKRNRKDGIPAKVAGVSKGKGFQGTIKRHNFKSGPKSHGSHNVRAPGSIGASAWPARVMKGVRGPGQMGNKRATQRGLEIVRVDPGQNLLLVRGAVPGARGGLVEVRSDA